MTTYMIESKALATNIWAKAMNITGYIHNKVPHSSAKGKTHFEAYTDHNHDVSNLTVFGPTTWARIPLDKRKNLEPLSI